MKKKHTLATVGTLLVGMVLGFGVYVNAQEGGGGMLETVVNQLFGKDALVAPVGDFKYKDDLVVNPESKDLKSGPITGKISGDRLTAQEFNRLLELASEGSGGASLPTCFEGEILVYDAVLLDWKCGTVASGGDGLKQDACAWTDWFRVESGNSPQLVPVGHYVAGADYQSTTGGNDGQLRIYHCEGSGGGTGSGTPGVIDLITPNYTTGYTSYTGEVDASGYSFIEFGGFDARAGSRWTGNDNGSASTMTPVTANGQAAINLGSDGEDAFILLEFDANKNMSFSLKGFTGGVPRLAFVRGINVAGGGTTLIGGGDGASPIFHTCNHDGTAVAGKGTDEACSGAQSDEGRGTDRYRAMNCKASDYTFVELASNMWYRNGFWSTQVSNSNVLCENGTIVVVDLEGTGGTGGGDGTSGSGGNCGWYDFDEYIRDGSNNPILATSAPDGTNVAKCKKTSELNADGATGLCRYQANNDKWVTGYIGLGSSRCDNEECYLGCEEDSVGSACGIPQSKGGSASSWSFEAVKGAKAQYYACKGGAGGGSAGSTTFVNFDGTSCATVGSECNIRKSNNVEKVTKVAAGRYTIHFTKAFSDNKYLVLGTTSNGWNGSQNNRGSSFEVEALNTVFNDRVNVETTIIDSENGYPYDFPLVHVMVYDGSGIGGGTSGPGGDPVSLKNIGCSDGQLLSGFDENGDAKCTTIGGSEYNASPPMIFELNKGSNTTDWVCWDNIDLKDYCGDFDGCTIRMIMNHKTDGWDQVKVIDQHIYMEETESFSSNKYNNTLYGHTRQGGGGDYNWVNGTGTRLDTIAGPWSWAYIFNYKHYYCPDHPTHKAYPANEPYKFSFMTHPSVRTRYIVYDSLSDQSPIEVIQDCASQDGIEVDGKCILPRSPLKDFSLLEYGEGGTRSPADTPRNYAKLIQNTELESGKKYAFILATSGERMGERTILTNGSQKNEKMNSRCYNSGWLSGDDIKFSHMDGTGAPGNAMISYQGTFEYNPNKAINSYQPLGLWGDFTKYWTTGSNLAYQDIAAYTSACSDPGKGGYMMYVFEYDELKNIMDAFYAKTGADYHKFNDPLSTDPVLLNNHWIK